MFTQTRPCPPPGAGALLGASAVPDFAGADVEAAALVPVELFGLNRSPRLNLAGDADAEALAAAAAPAFV